MCRLLNSRSTNTLPVWLKRFVKLKILNWCCYCLRLPVKVLNTVKMTQSKNRFLFLVSLQLSCTAFVQFDSTIEDWFTQTQRRKKTEKLKQCSGVITGTLVGQVLIIQSIDVSARCLGGVSLFLQHCLSALSMRTTTAGCCYVWKCCVCMLQQHWRKHLRTASRGVRIVE